MNYSARNILRMRRDLSPILDGNKMSEKYEAEIYELLRTLEGIKYAQEQVRAMKMTIDSAAKSGDPYPKEVVKNWTEEIWEKRISEELKDCQRRIEKVKDFLIDKRNQVR